MFEDEDEDSDEWFDAFFADEFFEGMFDEEEEEHDEVAINSLATVRPFDASCSVCQAAMALLRRTLQPGATLEIIRSRLQAICSDKRIPLTGPPSPSSPPPSLPSLNLSRQVQPDREQQP